MSGGPRAFACLWAGREQRQVWPAPPRTAPRSEHSMSVCVECVHTAFSHVSAPPRPHFSHAPPPLSHRLAAQWLIDCNQGEPGASEPSVRRLAARSMRAACFARQNTRLLPVLPLLTIVLSSLSQVGSSSSNDNPHVIILKLTGSRCGPLPP